MEIPFQVPADLLKLTFTLRDLYQFPPPLANGKETGFAGCAYLTGKRLNYDYLHAVALFYQENRFPEHIGNSFGDNATEKPRADDNIIMHKSLS